MPPIKVYAGSAINAAKASDASPQTDEAKQQPQQPSQPATTTATTTTTGATAHGYPPAQPGAAPSLPQQTATPFSNVQHQPTPTQPLSESGPPPPQPGAVPVPPPPRAGQAPPATGMPPQMSWPAPEAVQGRSSTATAAPHATGGSYPQPQPDFSPPAGGGYQQNVHAAGHSGGVGGGYEEAEDGGTVWDTAKKWAASAGESLAAAEHEVWRRINKD